ncbi:MAG: diguanylate cyclase [Rhodocyclaceae bacterium]|nr:diguanylate cyclase [Rhodocyclaceae bacterium]MDZ4213643.1 diguanylate cyclase [Rhodocyclaceae bacterium]
MTAWQTRFLRNILLALVFAASIMPLYTKFVSHPQYVNLLVKMTEDDAARVASHLSQAFYEEGVAVTVTEIGPHIQEILQDFRLVKVKLFSADGMVIYSTDPADEGKLNEHAYFREQVARGQVYSKIVHKKTQTAEQLFSAADVVETYHPIMHAGRFLGAFELYYDVTERLHTMDHLVEAALIQMIALVVLLTMGILFFLLRAAQTIAERNWLQRSLQASEERFRSIADSAQDGIIEIGYKGEILLWNPAAERIFGFNAQEALGTDLHRLIAPLRFAMRFDEHFAHFQRTGTGDLIGRTFEMIGLDKAGQEFPVEISLAAIEDDEGYRAIGIVRDIRQRKEAEQRLKLGSRVIQHASEGIIVTDARGNISMSNPAFTQLTGYTEAEVLGANPRLLQSGRHNQEFYASLWAAVMDSGYWQGEIWNRRKNGEIFPEWMSLSAIRGSDGQVTNYVAMFSDISKLKEAADDLERMAFYDPLTALPNRMLFKERLERSLKEAKRADIKHTGLLYLDLDKFKQVNDTYGHTTGDALLQEAAKRLTGSVREVDTVARLGGDEFAIVLQEIPDVATATRIAEKIITAIHQPFEIAGHRCEVGASIGIAIAPDDATTIAELIELADAAMYQAKKDGRNRFKLCSVETRGRP